MAHLKSITTSEEQQYEIWRKMSAAKTVKLASDFSMFCMRLYQMTGDEELKTITPEDLILSKLRWVAQGGGEHHLEDIRSVVRRMGKNLDHQYLTRQIKEQALESEWKEAKIVTV